MTGTAFFANRVRQEKMVHGFLVAFGPNYTTGWRDRCSARLRHRFTLEEFAGVVLDVNRLSEEASDTM